MWRRWGIAAMLACSILIPDVGVAQAKPSLAVLPLKAKRVPAEVVDILDELLVTEVDLRGVYQVLGASDINAILGLEKMKEVSGCDDATCAATIGGALGVQFLIAGSVSRLGNQIIVNIKLIDTRESVVNQRGETTVADEEKLYAEAVRGAVSSIFAVATPPAESDVSAPARAGTGSVAGPPQLRFEARLGKRYRVAVVAADGKVQQCPSELTKTEGCSLSGLAAGSVQYKIIDEDTQKEVVDRIDVPLGGALKVVTVSERWGAVKINLVMGGGIIGGFGGPAFAGLLGYMLGIKPFLYIGSGMIVAGLSMVVAGLLADSVPSVEVADLARRTAALEPSFQFGIVPVGGGLAASVGLLF